MSPLEWAPDARPDSAGKSGERDRPVIEFFIDRSLGRKHLAQALGVSASRPTRWRRSMVSR